MKKNKLSHIIEIDGQSFDNCKLIIEDGSMKLQIPYSNETWERIEKLNDCPELKIRVFIKLKQIIKQNIILPLSIDPKSGWMLDKKTSNQL